MHVASAGELPAQSSAALASDPSNRKIDDEATTVVRPERRMLEESREVALQRRRKQRKVKNLESIHRKKLLCDDAWREFVVHWNALPVGGPRRSLPPRAFVIFRLYRNELLADTCKPSETGLLPAGLMGCNLLSWAGISKLSLALKWDSCFWRGGRRMHCAWF